jgi:hypothetical protein
MSIARNTLEEGMRDKEDCNEAGYPQAMATMAMRGDEPTDGCDKRPDMKRKGELFELAKGIAVQVAELTKRRERCLLRQMVEMLLD